MKKIKLISTLLTALATVWLSAFLMTIVHNDNYKAAIFVSAVIVCAACLIFAVSVMTE